MQDPAGSGDIAEGARMRPVLDIVPRDFALGDAPGAPVDVAWEPQVGARRVLANWNQYMAMATAWSALTASSLKRFDYEHPTRLSPTHRGAERPYRSASLTPNGAQRTRRCCCAAAA
jgi:hypothetical protein